MFIFAFNFPPFPVQNYIPIKANFKLLFLKIEDK